MKFRKRMFFLALPLMMGFFLFYVLPMAYSLYYSVIENAFSRKFVGIDNYIRVVQNSYFQLAVKNTIEFIFTGVPVLVALSLVLALVLQSMGGRLAPLRAMFILPMLLPSAAVAPVFSGLFTSDAGLLAQIMGDAGTDRIPIYLMYLWKNSGFNIILFLSALTLIPRELYEAAALDGARSFQRFRYITFPLITPTVFFVVVMSIVQSLRIFKEAYLLYGAYPDPSVYLIQHYMNNHFYKLNYQNLTSGAIMCAVAITLMVAMLYRYERRMDVVL